MDEQNINFVTLMTKLREQFGVSVCPVFIPAIEGHQNTGFINLINNTFCTFDKNGTASCVEIPAKFKDMADEYKLMLSESLAETSEELMEKYFAGDEFTLEETWGAMRAGMKGGSIIPVFTGSAYSLAGIEILCNAMADFFPSPLFKKNEKVIDGDEVKDKEIATSGPVSVFVFKTVADPFVGKMSYFKVMSGTVKRDMLLRNLTTEQTEKFAHIYTSRGKKQTEVDELSCGDIGFTSKLISTNTNDTLAEGEALPYSKISFPSPYLVMAVTPLAKGDEDKISSGINKLLEEDLTIRYHNNAETKQLTLFGLGEIHLDVIISRLKSRFGASVELSPARVAYRETIKKTVKVEGKHKKQSGGHGQYGHVWIEFSPGEEEGLTFTESIFGGSVPKNFHPAVEKGLLECMNRGVLAGFPVVHLKANLFDGSYHDVDSSEMSFKMAASLAFKEGLKNAMPIILEPIGELKTFIPDGLMGDVIGDINKRRGRVMGMNPASEKSGYTIIEAEVPSSEMMNYTVALRAMSGGRGSFEFKFIRYEEAPAPVATKVIEEAKRLSAAEE
ncbi:MAG: elongation factor G [Eubacteriales bacterium]